MADHGDLNPTDEPEGAITDEGSNNADGGSNTKVPRWVIKAITLFWVGWAVTYVGTGMLRNLRGFLIIVLISLFLGFAIEPAVNKLERWGVRRGLGVWIMYLLIFVGIVGFSAAIGTTLATQINNFIDEAPRYVEDAESWLRDNVDEDIDLSRVTEEFVDGGGAADLANRFADDVVNLGTTVVNVLFQTFTVLLFAFYIVAEGPKLRRTVCSFLPPARQRTVLSVWDLAIEKTGGYIFSRGVLAVLSAIAHWIAFEMLNVPFSVPLALWVGIMSQFIPVVGTYIAGALPILITLIDTPRTGLFVLLVVLAYQQIENYLFAPKVTAQTMEIHVAVAYGSVLVGSALLGVVGALLALPFAATMQAFISGYRQHFEVEEDALTESATRRGRRLT
ncbi:MAG: AI-2E family transporter [Actinomycetota bacterium]|nr:AI-2E family transporter [Actinomycetota bacterium]MEC7966205.1 AI-2E family transporter [Actinomycetota bacterium]|tara:strand:+ start:3105 stop:4277 length:1173 start_codon:yes stop_codon:yes gene_type:complete